MFFNGPCPVCPLLDSADLYSTPEAVFVAFCKTIILATTGISPEGTKRLSPPENFTARRYQAVSFHPPSRPVRFIGLRFTVLTRDIFITGLGFPLRQDLGSYSVRTHKYDGMLRCSYRVRKRYCSMHSTNESLYLFITQKKLMANSHFTKINKKCWSFGLHFSL